MLLAAIALVFLLSAAMTLKYVGEIFSNQAGAPVPNVESQPLNTPPTNEAPTTLAQPDGASSIERGRIVAATAPKIGTPEWTTWYQNLTAEDRRSWAMAEDDKKTLSLPTQIEKGKMMIEPWNRSTNRLFNSVILTNYKTLLHLQRAIGVRPFQIKTIRTEKGLVSSIGARLADRALRVAWDEQKVSESAQSDKKGWESPVPQAIPEDMFLTSGGKEIGFANRERSFRTKWEDAPPESLVFPLALDSEYRVSVP